MYTCIWYMWAWGVADRKWRKRLMKILFSPVRLVSRNLTQESGNDFFSSSMHYVLFHNMCAIIMVCSFPSIYIPAWHSSSSPHSGATLWLNWHTLPFIYTVCTKSTFFLNYIFLNNCIFIEHQNGCTWIQKFHNVHIEI